MGRPQKQTVDYFPHDTDAADGRTLTILQNRYGNDGYAFWFRLLERLGKTNGHYIDCRSEQDLEYFAAKTTGIVSATRNPFSVTEMLDYLSFLGAIDKTLWEHKVIYSQNFVNNIAGVYQKRGSKCPQKPYFCNGNCPSEHLQDTETELSVTESTQSKVKYSKVNNIFLVWNSEKIIVHQKLTNNIKATIDRVLKNYSEEEICQSIKNYTEILKDEQYYFKYSWTLKDFLTRGLEKFMDGEIAKKNYRKDKENGTHRQGAGRVRTSPDEYTEPDELRA